MIVTFADVAETDLEAIGDWIAEDNPHRALSFVDMLRDHCLSLASRPRRFPEVRRFGDISLRKLTVRGYLIFYVAGSDAVEVVRIVHGSRDWVSMFSEPQ
ncbi:type II toxin-antitoxin system RelE/ParE family toxin [Sphingomonas sp. So64.6b]|uniref:type II toxin-antitoxin system RelE/ParE family toxin n=1 Tax=Sphingomonas sp. So64.6b TaxID=2997354 RepID=UPI00160402B2|nr:type II toxin-antitoxin system RelE/ParE family toxin [Sphingomonas sp. So64.6b]QNA83082.1 type II toxin-antitoxin system RelE/ParE family toxin [Sphingomonas sp. So64.6b]